MKDGIIFKMFNWEEQILQEVMGSPGLPMFRVHELIWRQISLKSRGMYFLHSFEELLLSMKFCMLAKYFIAAIL